MEPLLVEHLPDPSAPYYLKFYEERDFHLPWHAHSFFELTHIVRGAGTRMVGYRMDRFQDGDVVLLGPNLPHAWHNVRSGEDEPVKAVTLFFRPNFPSEAFFRLPDNTAMAEILHHSRQGIAFGEPLRSIVADQLGSLGSRSGQWKALGVLEIIAMIAESDRRDQLRPILTPDALSFSARRSQRIQRVLGFISDHLDEPLSSRQLAEQVNMHPSALGRLFRRSTGSSLVEFIHRARITRACRLLDDPAKSITEIAFEVGFQNLSHFNRIFRRLEGMPPSAYRRRWATAGTS